MEKIKANYYYVPICTESFATLDRLSKFFATIEESVQFKTINIFTTNIKSDQLFGRDENKFIDSLKSNQALLLYGKLFIDDNEIPGFPPSRLKIEELLRKHHIEADYDLIKSHYNEPTAKTINFDGDFRTEKIEIQNCHDQCTLCTKYSRYINEENYLKENWAKYESEKTMHLVESINKNRLIGFIEYYEDEPIGFIEGYSTEDANRYGFTVHNIKKSCMITCLHIREEAKGYGISKKLINSFINSAKEKGFGYVEVVAFPNKMNWQPIGLYEKMNFKEVRKIGKYSLMSLEL